MPGDPIVAAIVAFLREIGLIVSFAPIEHETVLPGIHVDAGALVIDRARLLYPGDLLHEAGHLAVLVPERRGTACGTFANSGDEIGAIAWSYAAAAHLQIEPKVVFHDAGYRGCSTWYAQQYTSGSFIGIPLLQWMDMTVDPKRAVELGVSGYPAMRHWLNPGPNGSE